MRFLSLLTMSVPLIALSMSACKPRTDKGSATLNYGTDEAVAKKPLTAAERHDLYYLSEGAELIPYFLVKAIQVKIKVPDPKKFGEYNEITVPYLDPRNLKRFGFIDGSSDEVAARSGVKLQEPLNPENLPVGISLSIAPDTQLLSLGVNCASCHVGELKYQAKSDGNWKTMRVDGGANMVDIFGFYGGIFEGLQKGFAQEGGDNSADGKSPAAKTWKDSFSNAVSTAKKIGTEAVSDAKKYGESAKFLTRATYHASVLSYKYRNWESKDDPVNWKARILERMDVARRLFSYVLMNKVSGTDFSDEAFVKTLNVDPLRTRMLLARMRYTKALYAAKANTGPIFGLADSVAVAYILLGAKSKNPPPPSPISIPHLFNIETVDWFHFTANTTSIIDRNLIQAVGLGATTDVVGKGEQTYATTARLENLDRMESIYYKLSPPAFPADGRRDLSAATQELGKKTYLAECARCHQPTKLPSGTYRSNSFTVKEIGTDPTPFRVVDYKYPDENGGYLPHLIGDVAAKVKDRYMKDHNVPQAKIDEWQNRKLRPESIWRYLGAWDSEEKMLVARPLDGVWATAPFLHNGAVPNLAELLKPASERTKVFYLGHRYYDTERVGYTVETSPNESINAVGRVDTSIPGFFNVGHEYGTNLSAEEKTALLEFLKGFGAGASRPTIMQMQ